MTNWLDPFFLICSFLCSLFSMCCESCSCFLSFWSRFPTCITDPYLVKIHWISESRMEWMQQYKSGFSARFMWPKARHITLHLLLPWLTRFFCGYSDYFLGQYRKFYLDSYHDLYPFMLNVIFNLKIKLIYLWNACWIHKIELNIPKKFLL